jgi:hypothetical protein
MDRPLGSDLRRDGSRNGGGGHHPIGLGGVGIGKGRRGISSVGPSCQRAQREKTSHPEEEGALGCGCGLLDSRYLLSKLLHPSRKKYNSHLLNNQTISNLIKSI